MAVKTSYIKTTRSDKTSTIAGHLTVSGNLSINGNLTFGNLSTDTITLTGLMTVATDQKVQFRDTGIYIQSQADGKLKLSADGVSTDDITMSGTVAFEDDIVLGSTKNITLLTTGKVCLGDTGTYINQASDGKIVISSDGTGLDDVTVAGTLTVNDKITAGTSSDAGGIALTDTQNKGIAFYSELPSAGTALIAGTVARGIWSRFLVNKAQNADVSLFGAVGHLRVKATTGNGANFGLWAYYEQSGTVTTGTGYDGALRAKVEGATLTATNLYGIMIDSAVTSGSTITNHSAICIKTDVEGAGGMKGFANGIEIGASGVSAYVIKSEAITSIVATRASPNQTATCDGYLKCRIESKDLLIPLYNAATIA